MFLNRTPAFSSFAVKDLAAAQEFYRETLGLTVTVGDMGVLNIQLEGGGRIFVYDKPDHEPAGFTVLNFAVDDVEEAVDQLNARGVATKIYGDTELADMPPNDEKGIVRSEDGDAEIAWFTDPSGNVLAVLNAAAFSAEAPTAQEHSASAGSDTD